jgi:two-component system, NtrC family, sensor kinase
MHNIKRYILVLSLFLLAYWQATAQAVPDSVIRQYKAATTEKQKLLPLYIYVYDLRMDSSFFTKAQAVTRFLASVGDQRSQDLVQLIINDQLSKTGDYATALASCLEILNRFEQKNDRKGIFAAYRQLMTSYFYAGDRVNDVFYGKKAMVIAKELNDAEALHSISNNISTSYSQDGNMDSALLYARIAVHYAKESGNIYSIGGVLSTLSEAFIAGKQYDSALIYARQSISHEFEDELMKIWVLNDLSQIFLETNQYDSAKYYARAAAGVAAAKGYKDQQQRAYEYLSRSFDKTNVPDSAFIYLRSAVAIKDSLYNREKITQVQSIMTREQDRLQEIESNKLAWKNKIRIYGLVTGLVILGVIAFILLRNNRQKKKANEVLENTLVKLRSTQTQLVQSEKMASLGELTAGIAHEIQNPLNFVNNFSEVNTELIDEMKNELKAGNVNDAISLADNVKQNNEKISHHGKRADSIVKGMLQHSRNSSGQKELTDINALADECMRLSYHGLRAKDKSFNAKTETDLDNSLPKINIAPQDIGRVVLNLFTNAFYSVMQKKKLLGDAFEPLVTVKTAKTEAGITISIRDNGNGVPQKVIDKIFQPFFTTKPVGEGTGLGLSMSYDIITKGHGGQLKVETKEGEFAQFTIILPTKS